MRYYVVTIFIAVTAFSQEYKASLSVRVSDPSYALVPQAHAILSDSQKQHVYEADTDTNGAATFAPLEPGNYSLEITKSGFDKISVPSITLAVRDQQILSLQLTVAAESSSVTVTAAPESVATDASMGVSLDQAYFENLPINGRGIDVLAKMAPGITSGSAGLGPGDGINANGLRSNTNYYTMDGVSLNTPLGGGGPGPAGPFGGGPPPGVGGGSGLGSSISLDGMQEMRVQTSSFAPEFGRSPGAQISMTSRGGSDTFHGSAYYYFRNRDLNANDWFANSRGYGRADMQQNRAGGTLGGPVIKHKTYFFLSYEALRLVAPSTLITSVPDQQSRLSAPAEVRPYLNAFPLPNGAEQTNGAAEYHALLANPSSSDSASVRIDHLLTNSMTIFGRYSYAPTSGSSRGGFSAANVLTHQNSNSQTATIGFTRTGPSGWVNDARVNYSLNRSLSYSAMDNYGGAQALSDSEVFPTGIDSSNGQFSLNVLGVGGYSFGGKNRSTQQQINVVDSMTRAVSAHTLKVGLDYRHITPTYYKNPYTLNATFNAVGGGAGTLADGTATNIQVTSNSPAVYPEYTNFSAYAQDTWRAGRWTTITYGLRWDVNPAPGIREGPRPLALSSDAIAGVTQNDPLYPTRWFNVAPRFGLAYQMDDTPGKELVLRMGAGLFYDIGYGVSGNAFNGAPYSSVRTISLAVFPLSASDLIPPALPPTRPYGQVTTADNNLEAPRVTQWNVTLERNFGSQTLSVGYVGDIGARLLRTSSQPSFGNAYGILQEATNGASSDYHGLQVQFRRRLSRRLQTQVSYTWAHSIDSASNDVGGGFATIFGSGQQGNSDFDIRHNLNWSGSYRLPSPNAKYLRPLLGNWYADWLFQARTSLPFDVQGITTQTSNSAGGVNQTAGLFAQVRPDYTGQPVWIRDPDAPGGMKLNPDAFSAPTTGYAQGDLGRNTLRGFDFVQLDLSLRRQIPITERVRLNISVQAYNVLNHPNFSNPSALETSNLSSPTFGLATRTVGGSIGGGSVYQSGGPRSLELSARFQF